jgi:hypothetical protein
MSSLMKSRTPSQQQLAFRRGLEACMKEHGQTLEAIELLAVTAHLVGQLIALQDQRTVTPAMAMDLVSSNIEQGNREVIDGLLSATGGTA